MLYYLFTWLDKAFNFPGAGVFQYISFRAAMSVITSLIIMLIFGKPFIKWLRKKQIGETVRDLKLEGQKEKEGTPTMGGLLILAAIVIPTLLFAKLDNIYVLIMLGTTVWLGLIGFIDDYIKVFKKHKEGLRGKYKVIGQVLLGLAVGLLIMYHPDITIKETSSVESYVASHNVNIGDNFERAKSEFAKDPIKSTKTTIPFVKSNELDYAKTITWMGDWAKKWVWLVYVIIVIFVVTATSNGANLTDGIDGLASGTSIPVFLFFVVLTIAWGETYLQLGIFASAMVGGLLGFLVYNFNPAKVFMGDTGSLFLGGAVAALAFAFDMPLILITLGIVYIVETMSDIIQVGYFKLTHGKRVFRMAPFHHHLEMGGWTGKKWKEKEIFVLFTGISLLFAIISFIGVYQRYPL